MVGRAVIFIIVAMFIIVGLITQRINASGRAQTENAVSYYQRQSGQNIAQTGVNMALRKLKDNPAWRAGFGSAGSPIALLDGSTYVELADLTFFGKPVVRIFSVGLMPAAAGSARSDTSIAYVLKPTSNGSTIPGAITTNNNVSTLGTLDVDGREHDTSGTVIPVSGTYGIWTTGVFTQSGNSKIGGTAGGIDYVPTDPPSAAAIAQNQVYAGGYPGSPDSVFGGSANGYPEGTFMAIARSGLGGSQYVTNPASLTFPLRGVTYVELPSAGSWLSANITGSGILIVHNAAKNAIIKAFTGTFRGLLIADDVDKIHADITGAVVSLTPAPASGNTIGNGNGSVLWSREALRLASVSFLDAGQSGSENAVLAWWE